jgi:hypothetical protein
VQVLQHQQQRPPLLAEPVKDGQRRLEQVELRVGGVGVEPASQVGERRRAAQRPQRLHQRQVGQAGADQVDAAPAQHGRAGAPRPLGQLAGQPRLADPGLAGDQHGTATAGDRLGERGLQQRQLGGAPDQAPRCRLGSHPATIRPVARCAARRLTASMRP